MSKLSQEIKECVSCPQINGKPYGRWKTLNTQQKINIWNLAEQCEFYEELADKSIEELTKYKRAFEILKPLMKEENLRIIGDTWTINQILYLTQEEYELLEELMNNENTK